MHALIRRFGPPSPEGRRTLPQFFSTPQIQTEACPVCHSSLRINKQRRIPMRRLQKLFVILTIVAGGLMASPSASAHAVLILSSGAAELDAQLSAVLRSQGHIVTVGSDFRKFTGDGLEGQDVVFLWPILDDGNSNMPLTGQTAIVNFVSAGGRVVSAALTCYMAVFGAFQVMITLLSGTANLRYYA